MNSNSSSNLIFRSAGIVRSHSHSHDDKKVQKSRVSQCQRQLKGTSTRRGDDDEEGHGQGIILIEEVEEREIAKNGFIKSTTTNKPKKAIEDKLNTFHESYNKCSIVDALCTYFCYAVIVIVGYVKEFFVPPTSKEKNRQGYVPLYNSFEAFYTRNVFRRISDCWNNCICSVPGAIVTLMDRYTTDYGWTLKFSGKKFNCINMGSYNYLGFAENLECRDIAIESVKKFGIGTASTRIELGTTKSHHELEKLVARFLGTEDSLICSMGFACNAYCIPSFLSKETLVLSDEKNHASIIQGLRFSTATVQVFKHNDMDNLELKLREAFIHGRPRTHLPWSKIFVFVEGVYSMEGTIVPLKKLIELKKKYGFYIYLDEAHSIGSLGKTGKGVVEHWGCSSKDVDILMGTFTKTFAASGGYLAGSLEFITLLRRHSISHCYGTVLPTIITRQIITTMKIILGEDGSIDGVQRIQQLAENSRYFREELKKYGFIVYGDNSPVIPVALYLPTKIAYVVREMKRRNIACVSVGFPATKICDGRTRFCISASHSKEMLDKVLEAMKEIGYSININKSAISPNEEIW